MNPLKNIKNFIKIWRRDGFKETYKQWKIRFYELQTPERLMKQELIGLTGSLFGLILALIFLVLLNMWYFIVWLSFVTWITYVQLKGKLKVRKALEEQQEELKRIGGMYKE